MFIKNKQSSSKRELTVQSWIILKWNDHRLSWDPKKYDDLNKNYAPLDLLWIPDITLLES